MKRLVSIMDCWKEVLEGKARPHICNPLEPPNRPPGFDLPSKASSSPRKVRTGQCADSLHKWDRAPPPECDCGAENQTVHPIVTEFARRDNSGQTTYPLYSTHHAIEYITYLIFCLINTPILYVVYFLFSRTRFVLAIH